MTLPWLSIVGLGEDGMAGLSPSACQAIRGAKILVGGKRHLALIPESENAGERWLWPSPLHHIFQSLEPRRGEAVCILASGDPMDHGVGVLMSAHFENDEMEIYPAPGAFSLACARLGWPRHDIETLSLHGRPYSLLNASLRPGARLLILCHDGTTPDRIATDLKARGFGASLMTAFSHLGGEKEQRWDGVASAWVNRKLPDLVTLAMTCRGKPGDHCLLRSSGLPDDLFHHDGQITKQGPRAATISALLPLPGRLLWDIGAGCGSIAIEWLRTEPTCQAIAIERDPQRCHLITANAHVLGVPRLRLENATAPDILSRLPQPDTIFIGGGLSGETGAALLETCWQALPSGGRLVANVITETSISRLSLFATRTKTAHCRFLKLACSPGHLAQGSIIWDDKQPIIQMIADKNVPEG